MHSLGKIADLLHRARERVWDRSVAAHACMVGFVGCTSYGAGLIYEPAGWITGGVTLGLYGWLLGNGIDDGETPGSGEG